MTERSRQPHRLLALTLALLFLAGGAWFALRVRRAMPVVTPPRPVPTLPGGAEITLQEVTIYGVSGGKIVWKVEAESFNLSKGMPTLSTGKLKKVSILNNGTQEMTLTADGLEQNRLTGDISVTGHVVIAGQDCKLQADRVNWDAQREVLTFPRDLQARVGDFTLSTPTRTEYDVKAGTLNCTGSIELTAQGNTLRAGGATVQLAEQRYTLHDPVEAAFDVESVESWVTGTQPPPHVPELPAGVKARYQKFLKEGRQPKTTR